MQRAVDVKVIPFNDYTQPNEALEHGDFDANAFQHKPYLDNQIKTRGYHIIIVGYTALWPIGLYSRRHHKLADLPHGAVIGVPNDPSNEGRALNLLAAQNIITLREGAGILATTADIVANPKGVTVKELDAGIVGRSIADLDAAVVNGDWAAKSGLTAADRLATEAATDNPYRNFIAVKAGHEDDAWVKPLVAAYQNDEVAGSTDERTAGNGSLMRLSPVALHALHDQEKAGRIAAEQSRTTHGAPQAVEACVWFTDLLRRAILGEPKASLLTARPWGGHPAMQAVASGAWRGRSRGEISSSGYVIHTLERRYGRSIRPTASSRRWCWR